MIKYLVIAAVAFVVLVVAVYAPLNLAMVIVMVLAVAAMGYSVVRLLELFTEDKKEGRGEEK